LVLVTINHHPHQPCDFNLAACSFGWWLMAGAGLFSEKSTIGWLLVACLFCARKVLLDGG
jgi:hypothetical protein